MPATFPAEVRAVTQAFLSAIDESAPGLVPALYLTGSLGFGEYFPGRSDVDFVAVLGGRPDDAALTALAGAHAAVRAAFDRPPFDGIHLIRSDLARSPDQCPDLPYMFDGAFHRAGRFEVHPVTWHELARHPVVVRGPALADGDVWTDDAVLRAFSYDNLTSYWSGVADQLRAKPPAELRAEATDWCVLGVSRLHHLLATGSLTSKSGAGRHALTAFEPRWHPIIGEALRMRERPAEPSRYDDDRARRGRETTEFTAMAIDAGLALGRASEPTAAG